MKIGVLSRRSSVSVRMLRYYEAKGLLNPFRSGSRYRIYSEEDIEKVVRIRTLNAAGLALNVIRRILPCVQPESALSFQPCEEFKSSLRRKLAELDDQLGALQESRRFLSEFLSGSTIIASPVAKPTRLGTAPRKERPGT